MLGVHSTVQLRHRTCGAVPPGRPERSKQKLQPIPQNSDRDKRQSYIRLVCGDEGKRGKGEKKKRKREKKANHQSLLSIVFLHYPMIPTILGDKWVPWQPGSRKGVLLYYHISTIQNLLPGPLRSVPTFCR